MSKDGNIGVSNFFDFLCCVFSRIDYVEDPLNIFLISGVFRILPDEIINSLSKISDTNFTIEDEKVFPKNLLTRDGNTSINFIEYAKRINELIENTSKGPDYKKETDENLKIISIADSNYGNVLIIGHKLLPNFVFVSYRGTYSTKTAASYSNPSSIFPFLVDITMQKKMLKGIAKITMEIIHTIFHAMEYMAEFLKESNKDIRPIPVFTGHSLGGGMATIASDAYCSLVQKKNKKDVFHTYGLNDKAICISFGSPRVLNEIASQELCSFVVNNSLIFHRFSNHGDPVTSLPPPGFGFYHPCSSKNDKLKYNNI